MTLFFGLRRQIEQESTPKLSVMTWTIVSSISLSSSLALAIWATFFIISDVSDLSF
jgi:hypothetical protein